MLGGLPYAWLPATAVLSSFSGILMAMMLVSIASNKVEGLAVSKLLGIIIFGIPLAWFANSYLRVIGCLLPTYWIMDILIKADSGQTVNYMLDFILGMTCTSVWFIILYRIFVKKLK
jgi:fluoroquinolone transport system permease protein